MMLEESRDSSRQLKNLAYPEVLVKGVSSSCLHYTELQVDNYYIT